ncbi:MAG: hypothetical protein QHH05_07800, partial [Syntrophomonadaceae bacterium]|nr:hypothetical protein [Syntrophomonadaceae bacterium]
MQRIACIMFPFFFSALARRSNRGLQGRPLLVCREGRVVGVSEELAGQPLLGLEADAAARRCPEALVLAADEAVCRQAHGQYLQVLAGLSPLVEPVDERRCFFDLSGSRVTEELGRLREGLRECGPGPALVGVGGNKLLAGLAARALFAAAAAGRSFSSCEVAPGDEVEFLRPLPLAWDWMLPARARERCAGLGLRRFGDVQRLSRAELAGMLGREGELLYRHSRGVDASPLVNGYPPGRVVVRIPFQGEVTCRQHLQRALREGVRLLVSQLQARRQGGRLATLSLLLPGGSRQWSRLVPWGYRDEGRLGAVMAGLLEQAQVQQPVLGMSLEASGLYDWMLGEQDLFAGPRTPRPPGGLESMVQALREKLPGGIRQG